MVLCGDHHTVNNFISAHGSAKSQKTFDAYCKGLLGDDYIDNLRALDRSLRDSGI